MTGLGKKMRKKVLISFFILILFVVGSISALFVYPDRTQIFIMETLNLKSFLNKKVKNFIAKKINDENIKVNIETINFLKPDWPNIAKIELNNVNVYSLKEKRKSNIKYIELGFSYHELLKNFFSNEDQIEFSYINFKDLTLNARIGKDKFSPGPLFKIFSLINQNNFLTQPSLKKILQNKIVVGKINLLLTDSKDLLKERIFNINCENVFISEYSNRSRSLNMDCELEKNKFFSLKANLTENFNTFRGKLKNINPNFLLDNLLNENLNFFKIDSNSKLNGTYNIKTNKNFNVQSINFLLDNSILISKNNEDEEIFKTKLNGVLSWEKKNNLLKFSDLLVDDKLLAFGELNLTSQKGFSNFSIKKILVKETKTYLGKYFNFNRSPFDLIFNNNLNRFRGGNFKNLSINIKFSILKEFIVDEISGLSNFSNIRFDYNDRVFKKIISTISGKFEFKLNPNQTDDFLFNVNLNASDGFALFNDNDIQYKFNNAKINGQFDNKNYLISKAEIFKKNNLDYSFHNIKINKNNFNISKIEYFKNKKLHYVINDAKISKMMLKKSFLTIKNNPQLSNFIKKKFNIELIGDTDLKFLLSGNLKNLNFDLKLNSNLKHSYLNIHYLDLIKKKNITSSIKSEISLIEGKIFHLKNTHLDVDSNIYKIGLIEFSKKKTNKVIIKNIQTPNLNIDKILISDDGKNLNIQAVGKKIDLSNLNKNLKSKNKINKEIFLDLTADLIKLNAKVSLTGNLVGEIKGSLFKSIAYGKMLLGGSSLLDNGKFEIHVDNKISRLEGLGLVGGAETKINLQKNINSFPSLIFDTSDGGKLLSALGFTQNIKSGEMKIKINFLNDEYDHYEGKIKSKKFSLINAPGIINSLSVLSFSGIGSIISGEGVFFDKGQVNIKVKKKIFNFDKLYLSSESLGIAAKGNLNLQKKSINMNGSVAPIKLISKILSIVPAVGELLTGLKKEGLFAGQFKMVGSIENPEIKLNTMSFAPGILRDLFSDDWLDNNNFFINGGMD